MLKRVTQPIGLIFKELKLVEWLSFSQTVKSTLLVLVISLVVGIITIAFDSFFYFARNFII